MANALGFNLGQVYKDVESVKTSRQNRSNQNALMRWKTEDRALSSARSNKLASMKQDIAAGEEGAMKALSLFDPQEAKAILDAFSSEDKTSRENIKANVDSVGRALGAIRSSKDQPTMYKRARQYFEKINPKSVERWPQEYDPEFVEFEFGRAMQLDDHLKNPQSVTHGDQSLLFKGGKEIGRTESGESIKSKRALESKERAAKRGPTGGSKASDESLMYKQSAELLGGLFDDSGNLQNLDPTTRNKVQSIATEATKIWETGGMTRTEAVTKAARKLNYKIQDLGATGTANRNELLQQYLPK